MSSFNSFSLCLFVPLQTLIDKIIWVGNSVKKKKKTLEIALRDGATYLVMNCIKPAEESEAMMFYSVEEPKWH